MSKKIQGKGMCSALIEPAESKPAKELKMLMAMLYLSLLFAGFLIALFTPQFTDCFGGIAQ